DDPGTLTSMNNLASSYYFAGQLDRALPLYEETLKLRKAKLGADHSDTLLSMHYLAISYAAGGRTQEALRLDEETVQRRKAKLGPNHPQTLKSVNNLAWLLATCPDSKLRDPKRAVELAQETVTSAPKEGNHWNTLGVALYRAGDWKAAIVALKK